MRIFAVCFLVWTMAAATISSAEKKLVPTTQLQMQLSFAPVVREASPAVVNIYATRVVAEQVSPFAAIRFFPNSLVSANPFRGWKTRWGPV